MPDVVITITAEEVAIIDSFYPETENGLRTIARLGIKPLAHQIIHESPSKLDPNKLSNTELRAEIAALDAAGVIPSYEERYPTIE